MNNVNSQLESENYFIAIEDWNGYKSIYPCFIKKENIHGWSVVFKNSQGDLESVFIDKEEWFLLFDTCTETALFIKKICKGDD